LHWIWQNSLFKTLAGKHRTSRTKIARQLRQPDGRYIHYEFRNGKRYELEVFQLKNRSVSTAGISVPDFINQLPNIYKYSSRTELLDRMSATCCEYCGTKTGYLEVHHV